MTKLLKRSIVLVLVLLPLAVAAFAGSIADEFIGLSRTYDRALITDLESGISSEINLRVRETELTNRLLADEIELNRVAARAVEIETGMRFRLLGRVQFEVSQEGRISLAGALHALQIAHDKDPNSRSEKIAMINGRPVDMRDGEWHDTPDGKRYWTSNKYPDTVLSPAEYRRYLSNASEAKDK